MWFFSVSRAVQQNAWYYINAIPRILKLMVAKSLRSNWLTYC